MRDIRLIAIHLPQFHPFPENDTWWGKGFTEWTNVTKAKPLFKDHYQPHLPTDLGFYDLRLEQTRIEQAVLAKEYGIFGFCYYHYWFNGKRLMQEPLDAMLQSGRPDFPFMFCWANENWTRKWDGKEEKTLISQVYSEEDDIKHMRFLCEHVFSDSRYIRVNGKPFFVLYRPSLIPSIQNTIRTWRNVAHDSGIGDLYLGYTQSFQLKEDPLKLGFDVSIDFQPDFYQGSGRYLGNPLEKLLHRLKIRDSVFEDNTVVDYPAYVQSIKKLPFPSYKRFPSVTPMWDNTPRRKDGAFIFKNADPAAYEDWLQHIIRNFHPFSKEENFIFINAWNEWAEGNHLEPCLKWGKSYLEATKRCIQNG